jgi:hypothetical protein
MRCIAQARCFTPVAYNSKLIPRKNQFIHRDLGALTKVSYFNQWEQRSTLIFLAWFDSGSEEKLFFCFCTFPLSTLSLLLGSLQAVW